VSPSPRRKGGHLNSRNQSLDILLSRNFAGAGTALQALHALDKSWVDRG